MEYFVLELRIIRCKRTIRSAAPVDNIVDRVSFIYHLDALGHLKAGAGLLVIVADRVSVKLIGDSNTVAFRQIAYIHLRAVVQRQLAEGKGAICGVKLDLEGTHLRGIVSRRNLSTAVPLIRIVRYFKRDTVR